MTHKSDAIILMLWHKYLDGKLHEESFFEKLKAQAQIWRNWQSKGGE